MHDYRKTVKITLIVTYIAIAILIAFTVFLPFLVRWFVEIRNKDQSLAATIMLTCYPCIPFAFAILFSIKALLKNVLCGLILGDKNNNYLKIVAISCLGASVVMIIGGLKYMPFLISGIAAMACALIVWTLRSVIDAALQTQREQEYESVRLFYEKDNNIGNR